MDDVVISIASGSKGNATFVKTNDVCILIDAGVSGTRVLETVNKHTDHLDAIVITHEHSDHVRGLNPVRKRFPDAQVLCTRGTADAIGLDPTKVLTDSPIQVSSVAVLPIPVSHDAAETIGLRLTSDTIDFASITDLGFWNDDVVAPLLGVQALLLESNYDEDRLWNGPYPTRLKYRVAGKRGHLSNQQARFLVEKLVGPRLQHVALAHLSDTNNTDELAFDSVRRALSFTTTTLTVAQQHRSIQLWPIPSLPESANIELF